MECEVTGAKLTVVEGAEHLFVHCRPRFNFHLGQIRLLNELKEHLRSGRNVDICVIPYTEHDQANVNKRRRVEEEIFITKEFYKNYLSGFPSRLKVYSTDDLIFDHSLLSEIQSVYHSLSEVSGSPVHSLVAGGRRAWASPNILFVPKCIAAIEQSQATHTICGEKHRHIADAFEQVLHRRGNDIQSTYVESLLDLDLAMPMDSTDSGATIIELNDDQDLISYKLGQCPDGGRGWLQHFSNLMLQDVQKSQMTRTGGEDLAASVFALHNLLLHCRNLLPYKKEREDGLHVSWNYQVEKAVGITKKPHVERLIQSVLRDSETKSVVLNKLYSDGFTDSVVMEAWEYQDTEFNHISNISVMKVGESGEIAKEAAAYQRFIHARRTARFSELRSTSLISAGYAVVAYQEAGRFLTGAGATRAKGLQSFLSLEQPIEQRMGLLRDLLEDHLYEVLYKHNRRIERYSPKASLEQFLPPSQAVAVGSVSDGSLLLAQGASPSSERVKLEVLGANRRNKTIKAFNPVSKEFLLLDLSNVDDGDLEGLSKLGAVSLVGQSVEWRRRFLQQRLSEFGFEQDGSHLHFEGHAVAKASIFESMEHVLSLTFDDVAVSPIHGDLHSGNILAINKELAVIDYGATKDNMPSLYDVCYLYAEMIPKVLLSVASVQEIARLFSGSPSRWLFSSEMRSLSGVLKLFQYTELPHHIKQLGDERLFNGMLGVLLIGRLKFPQKNELAAISILVADYFLSLTKEA